MMGSLILNLSFSFIFLILALQASAAPPERVPLVLGVAENAGDIPTFIGLEMGFYRDEGLDVTTKSWPAGKTAMEAMFRNEVDVATVADTPIVIQSFKRSDFAVIATFSHNNPYRMVADRADGILSPSDLRGHRVGVTTGTTAQFFLYSVLADLGIDTNEIIEVNIPSAESAEALFQHRVDAIAAFDPYGYYAQTALAERALVIPYEKIRHEETFNYVTRRDYLKSSPQTLKLLLSATRKAIEWTHNHRHEAIAVVARRLKMDAKVLDTQWGNHAYRLDAHTH